jgi:hypothetical protein
LNIKCVLFFCTNFVRNISHSKYNSAINYHKCGFSCKVSVNLVRFLKLNLNSFSKDFRKILISRFYENPSSGSRVVPCGRKDKHKTKVNSRSSQFRTSAYIYIYIYTHTHTHTHTHTYRGADKSLARPGRKQATATEDFDFHISYL